ncbi:MAG: ComEC/Rec2 family competence protein [Patescibacteria group bacterium]
MFKDSANFRKISNFEWIVFAIIAGAMILSFLAQGTSAQDDGFLHVHFLDVGQGDAIFIDFKGKQVLIDGGPNNKVLQELGRVMPFNDRSIDLLVLTHPDADHINGLIEVLNRYEVGNILENPLEKHNTPTYRVWNELKNEAKITQAKRGQIVDLGGGAYLEVLYPVNTDLDQSKTNNNSIVAKLVYGESELLLTGDIEAKVERELIGRQINIDVDFLKVPHHGSKTSSTEEFLNAVTPEVAFIQLSKDNNYGHPHSTVLERFKSRGIRYYRTDLDGAVELILDGFNYKINGASQRTNTDIN